MAAYIAQRLIDGAFDSLGGYAYVVNRRPDLKIGIDAYLADKGRTDLIVA